jgi:Arc/MetJ-type ribon-helix-helix transcriptional regulator
MDAIPAKITPKLLHEMDEIIKEGWYANRSELIRDAVREIVKKLKTERLEAAIKEDVAWGLHGKD